MTGRCKHRNLYYKEPSCFEKEILENNKKIIMGILDIESFGLSFNADGSILINYYIKEYHKNNYYHNTINYDNIKNNLDKLIIKQLIKDMKNFNVLITFNGNYFDLPFVRTRALIHNLKFIQYGNIKSIDIYPTMKNKFKIHRNSLKNACKVFKIDGKTELDFYTWIKAISGDKISQKRIDKHNKHDVIITEKLFDKIIEYERKINRSI